MEFKKLVEELVSDLWEVARALIAKFVQAGFSPDHMDDAIGTGPGYVFLRIDEDLQVIIKQVREGVWYAESMDRPSDGLDRPYEEFAASSPDLTVVLDSVLAFVQRHYTPQTLPWVG